MTREEAIKELKIIREDYWDEYDDPMPALDMAIKALEEEPCEDAISREEAIGAVANLFEMSEYPHPYPQGKPIRLKDIKEKLKQLPPAQPKIKVGHWIPSHIPESILDECSECGFSCGAFTFNYCPNCGCRMVKPQESEE